MADEALPSSLSTSSLPIPSRPIGELILEHFPGAKPQREILQETIDIIKRICQPTQDPRILVATSCCSDEINRDLDREIESLHDPCIRRPTGRVFVMGGLAGFPFVGKMGFGAFMHHVPDDGLMLVICASHIGITEQGTLGKVKRPGMEEESTACGAAIAALNNPAELHPIYDYQQAWVQEMVRPHRDRILSHWDSNVRQKTLAECISKAIRHYLEKIIPTPLPFPLAILSGIQINCEGAQDQDYFYRTSFTFLPKGQEHY